ncbi:unnamed protein product, partial [Discosporangium mesarthrocarpum]
MREEGEDGGRRDGQPANPELEGDGHNPSGGWRWGWWQGAREDAPWPADNDPGAVDNGPGAADHVDLYSDGDSLVVTWPAWAAAGEVARANSGQRVNHGGLDGRGEASAND